MTQSHAGATNAAAPEELSLPRRREKDERRLIGNPGPSCNIPAEMKEFKFKSLSDVFNVYFSVVNTQL
ncbi:hypothetical protein EYF80_016126 [Liparis tanakae]|uniref:Uncharacterized protein n=1 Tax=Liparis tanakae TaxID=230148 RepID=A0A4Z2I6Z4_9TELE|nr:hypothetical protein EYF80_016126 [Liparis tanakae]